MMMHFKVGTKRWKRKCGVRNIHKNGISQFLKQLKNVNIMLNLNTYSN